MSVLHVLKSVLSVQRETHFSQLLELYLHVLHVLYFSDEVVRLSKSASNHDISPLLETLRSILSNPKVVLQLLLSQQLISTVIVMNHKEPWVYVTLTLRRNITSNILKVWVYLFIVIMILLMLFFKKS